MKKLLPESVNYCQHDMVLWDSWKMVNFHEIIKDALNCSLNHTRSSWTDNQLFKSSHGTDKLAISEIIKRYKYRIECNISDMMADKMDAEDIFQNVCLAIFLDLQSFTGRCSLSHWIDLMTFAGIRTFYHDELDRDFFTIKKFV